VDWNVPAGQLPAYEHYRQTYSHRHDWVAFIDIDEFIVPFDNHIGSTLARAGSHSAVILSWLCFGPNGHEVRPASLIIQAFDARLPVGHPNNFPVKSIVRVSDFLGTWSPHLHRLSGPVCNAQGETVPNDHDHHGTCHKHAVIFHYYTKSRADWADKLARGRADAIDLTPVRQWAWFEEYAREAIVKDDYMMRWHNAVRRELWWLKEGIPCTCSTNVSVLT
jgi:hypothetical protein